MLIVQPARYITKYLKHIPESPVKCGIKGQAYENEYRDEE